MVAIFSRTHGAGAHVRGESRYLLSVQVACGLFFLAVSAFGAAPGAGGPAANLLGNPSFEDGREEWHLSKAGKTAATFTADQAEAADGKRSALLAIDTVEGWGVQFGQTIEAGAAGKTFTFAAVAKSVRTPVRVRLEIERSASPWDRAAASEPVTLTPDAWTEMHVTFRVEKPFPQGWFVYISCNQPQSQFRLDQVRLYEGEYVPYQQAARVESLAAGVGLYDTAAASSGPLPGAAVARKEGWTKIAEDQTDHAFRGAAVLANDRVAAVLRRGGPGVEVYGLGGASPALRSVLAPATGGSDAKLTAVAIVENSLSEAVVDATFDTGDGKTSVVRFELAMGQAFVKAEPRRDVTAMAVETPCRFLVLPDFFADDMVIDAQQIPVEKAELPSENFLLHLVPDRQALVMTVSNSREQESQIELAGQTPERLIRRSVIPFGKAGKLWVAVLEAPDIWYQRDIATAETGKVLPLEWKAPFAAQWRVDWQRTDKLIGSWEMIVQRASGEFTKYGWFGEPGTVPADRNRWTTVLGRFSYPCWLDRSGQGYLQPLARKVVAFQGPALIYPINRIKTTPLDRFTVVDVVRATLGVGPCEYILDVEGQGTAMKGRATCATRDFLKDIYSRKEQKRRRADIEKILDDVVIFVKHIRGRIEQYQEFGRELLVYLAQQRQAHPELAEFIGDMEAATRSIHTAYEKRKGPIKTPQYVIDLTEQFRRTLVDYEGDDALAKCTRIMHAIVDVGGNQDELVGECRLATRVLRQRSGLALATNPRAAEIAREIRSRTQKVLRNASSYEAPRQ